MGAPVTGAAVRALVTGAEPPFPMSAYVLSRFEDRSSAFDSSHIVKSPDDVST